ncbi:hypothetical protein DPMN_160645 [Dreissena polymorpha]|uniref:Uncharacterized protein n=1 Tax=Dreissena polymorpha TaxID=45954 RepID=A0A9D4EQM6_DREPO|nr:hypothetical protein DPMN_160645 [Dreissena polymorpha]
MSTQRKILEMIRSCSIACFRLLFTAVPIVVTFLKTNKEAPETTLALDVMHAQVYEGFSTSPT